MSLRFKQGPEVNGSMGLLISILVRYPEVGTVNYDPARRVLKFTFLLQRESVKDKLPAIAQGVKTALEVFHELEGLSPLVTSVEPRLGDGLASLEVHRDVESLSLNEIALLIDLLNQQAGQVILSEDEGEALQEEERLWQEELISHMLDSLKSGGYDQQVYAFREEGRVMVYNK
ncbi:conserved hypothetical protein [Heliomicrobium modesticaldum Ice1]|uniref:Uncharacterized protein n=1 Tax=Heliobacterium modesticaldum (strain ATCC 51547 / Ice1) TaxID=498761 RepID=B0TII9_HELMI|nr:hypothetical protein [Heliomicrobium modesticaldum]ABZ84930.1 conserved hypothetical protein [Heliomicrobium modesticaldum Ice1]